MTLHAPALLTAHHDVREFCCGVPNLDEWLIRRALANQASGASRTYVVADAQQRVAGYYALASGALAVADAPGRLRRNMPEPIPMAVLGRLAVDQVWAGKSLGAAMLKDAVLRVKQAADVLGIRGVLVHAISEDARQFYERFGFAGTPTHPMTLVLSIKS
jgi:GNAT superfamily N-acetyltransferase